jgi:hypothetical protein
LKSNPSGKDAGSAKNALPMRLKILGDGANPGKFFKAFKTIKSTSLKSFSDEAYGFIWCGAEPPHKVNVKVKVNPYK